MEAWKTYRSLSAEQKQILSQKKCDLSRPVDEWLSLLKPIAACDAVTNKAQGRFGCTFALLIAVTIASPFILGSNGWSAMKLAAIVLIVAATIAVGAFWTWLRRVDVSDNLRSFVVPVLALFREDVDPKSPVRLRLDLSKPTAASKKTGQTAPFSEGVYYKIVDTSYVDPWMEAEAVLVDGTKLSWSVIDRIRERKKTKRNARGKHKTKTKYTKKTDLEVQLALRTKTYALANAEVSGDGKRSKVEVQRSLRSDSLDPIDPRALVDAIVEVYRSARPAKETRA
ncbi:MAG TPA: hypothetical protein VGQ76_03775 [Thermoanaerobaculia bacterium]|jgi:hypothetical protein|nr:hypothetical protein [Thermoanaerobaculia bacterium]